MFSCCTIPSNTRYHVPRQAYIRYKQYVRCLEAALGSYAAAARAQRASTEAETRAVSDLLTSDELDITRLLLLVLAPLPPNQVASLKLL